MAKKTRVKIPKAVAPVHDTVWPRFAASLAPSQRRKGHDLSSKSHVALGLALSVLAASVSHAQAGFSGWGTANYEKPAPTPEAAPSPAPAIASATKVATHRHGPRERAAAVRKLQSVTPKLAAQDVPLAPTPDQARPIEPVSGPVESSAPTIRDLVTKHARENGIPDRLATAVVTIESRFNPKARGGSALGLMQIKYDTARSMGYAGGVTALLTPETNLHFGMKVLADAYKASNGDVCMTLARYQSGHRVTHASAANRAYCARARSLMARAS